MLKKQGKTLRALHMHDAGYGIRPPAAPEARISGDFATDEAHFWDAFLTDDEPEPLPEHGDFWIEPTP